MWSNEYKINNDELVVKTVELKKEIERLMNAWISIYFDAFYNKSGCFQKTKGCLHFVLNGSSLQSNSLIVFLLKSI